MQKCHTNETVSDAHNETSLFMHRIDLKSITHKSKRYIFQIIFYFYLR